MRHPLEPHPFAALFPELPREELTELARDIKERGELEPIILYKGVILDGRNRYRACQIAGVKPRIKEFDAQAARRSPEEFVEAATLEDGILAWVKKPPLRWNGPIRLN
jgi:ParB-like chromosome segregation protein Spo0J